MAEEHITDKDRQMYRYWMNWLKRAKKAQPIDEWVDAENALKTKVTDDNGKVEESPYNSGYRLQYEALKSFLDQAEPSFLVQPTKAYISDPIATKQAEADLVYLTYIWHEQNMQKAMTAMLDSTLQRNIGFTLPGFDKRKWMPTVRYLPARQGYFDPDDYGQHGRDSAIAYCEYISVEELVSMFPDLTQGDLVQIIKKGNGPANKESDDEDNPYDVQDGDEKLYMTVTLYHIFARDDAAIRRTDEDRDESKPDIDRSLTEKMQLETPKRHLVFVKGYQKALQDSDEWPYDLDDNEFPMTSLMFNTPTGQRYGFTDNGHMKTLDDLYNDLLAAIDESARWEATKKFTGPSGTQEHDVQNFLNDDNKTFIPDMIGIDGKAKIIEIDTGKFSNELVAALKIVGENRKEASALGELINPETVDLKDVTAIAFKTQDDNIHQRVNRRLNGPESYEKAIAENAIKILEIAHQFVPRLSLLEVEKPRQDITGEGFIFDTGETFTDYISLPWDQAQQELLNSTSTLIMLGADAILGPELAQFWRTSEDTPPQAFKLSTSVRVVPGSTRSITKERKAALLKQMYTEVYAPLYQTMNRPDLAVSYLRRLGQLAELDDIEDYLPTTQESQQFRKEQEQAAKQAQNQEALSAI